MFDFSFFSDLNNLARRILTLGKHYNAASNLKISLPTMLEIYGAARGIFQEQWTVHHCQSCRTLVVIVFESVGVSENTEKLHKLNRTHTELQTTFNSIVV